MIGTGEQSPFSIIDGTHRATALFLMSIQKPNFPWKALLITDPRMEKNRWFIGSQQAAQHIKQCIEWEADNRLW